MILLIFLYTLFLANTAQAHSTIAENMPQGCGYADAVWTLLPEKTGHPSSHHALSGKQGETGRRLLMYSDGSYLLSFEFFSPAGPEQDISCIVAHGTQETAYEATNLMLKALPEANLTELNRELLNQRFRPAN